MFHLGVVLCVALVISDENVPASTFRLLGQAPNAPVCVTAEVAAGEFCLLAKRKVLAAPLLDGVGLFDGVTLELRQHLPTGGRSKVQAAGNRLLVTRGKSLTAFDDRGKHAWGSSHSSPYTRSLISPKGRYVVTYNTAENGAIVSARSGKNVAPLPPLLRVVFVGDEQFLGYKSGQWGLFSAKSGRVVQESVEKPGSTARTYIPGRGLHWVDSDTMNLVRLSERGAQQVCVLATQNAPRRLLPFGSGLGWCGVDSAGPYVGVLRWSKPKRSMRFDIGHVEPTRTLLSKDGKRLYTLIRQPGVHRGFHLACYELEKTDRDVKNLGGGDAVFLDNEQLLVGWRRYQLSKGRWREVAETSEVASPGIRYSSRTHAHDGKFLIDRRNGDRRKLTMSSPQMGGPPGGVEFSAGLRIADGGEFLCKVDLPPKPTVKIYAKAGNKLHEFESSQYVRLGPDGTSYAVAEANSSGSESLVARNLDGSERWSLSGNRVRPVDVSPDGKFLATESGIVDAKSGQWVRSWPTPILGSTPRFDSQSKSAIVLVGGSREQPPSEHRSRFRTWHIFDLATRRTTEFAVPAGALPVDLSPDKKYAVARFGPLGPQRLLEVVSESRESPSED